MKRSKVGEGLELFQKIPVSSPEKKEVDGGDSDSGPLMLPNSVQMIPPLVVNLCELVL